MDRMNFHIPPDETLHASGVFLHDAVATDFAPLDSMPAHADVEATDERQTPLAADLRTLVRFQALMAAQGWQVQTARMIFDRVYAHERLAWAHSSADESLRSLALMMFRRMHAHDGEAVVPHND